MDKEWMDKYVNGVSTGWVHSVNCLKSRLDCGDGFDQSRWEVKDIAGSNIEWRKKDADYLNLPLEFFESRTNHWY